MDRLAVFPAIHRASGDRYPVEASAFVMVLQSNLEASDCWVIANDPIH